MVRHLQRSEVAARELVQLGQHLARVDVFPDAMIADITRWIDLGAPFDRPLVDRVTTARAAPGPTQADKDFWSFRPLDLGEEAPPVRARSAATPSAISWVSTLRCAATAVYSTGKP